MRTKLHDKWKCAKGVQPTLSLCLVVKSEGLLIDNCLRKIAPGLDEIVLVDTGSTDQTVRIAKKYGAVIVNYKWDGSLGRAREASIRTASSDWILVLDGDEEISPEDLSQLRRDLTTTEMTGLEIQFRNYSREYDIGWAWHPNDGKYPEQEQFSDCPGWSKRFGLRVFRNLPEIHYEEGYSVHTSVKDSLLRMGGEIGRSNAVIHHFQFRKGGEGYLAEKHSKRLRSELLHFRNNPKGPISPLICLNAGKFYMGSTKYRMAIKYLTMALKMGRHGHRAESYYIRGLAYLNLNHLVDAKKDFLRALKFDANNADVLAALGVVSDMESKPGAAKSYLRKALRAAPWHPMALNSLGVIYQQQKRHSDARNFFEKSLSVCPSFRAASDNLRDLNSVKLP